MMEFKEKNGIEMMCMEYSVHIVACAKDIAKTKREYKMTDQLLRAGTSIGANYGESKFAESDTDYVHKIKVALKECNESEYWIELLYKSEYIEETKAKQLYEEARQIEKVLTSCMKKAMEKIEK